LSAFAQHIDHSTAARCHSRIPTVNPAHEAGILRYSAVVDADLHTPPMLRVRLKPAQASDYRDRRPQDVGEAVFDAG
jgi:hypothetical protein